MRYRINKPHVVNQALQASIDYIYYIHKPPHIQRQLNWACLLWWFVLWESLVPTFPWCVRTEDRGVELKAGYRHVVLDFCNKNLCYSKVPYFFSSGRHYRPIASKRLISESRAGKICDWKGWKNGIGWNDHMAWRFVCFLDRTARAKPKTWKWSRKEGRETDQRKTQNKMQKN